MHNIEVEKSVMGYLLLENEEGEYVFSVLKEEHFYDSQCRKVFAEARRLFDKGEVISASVLSGKFDPALLAELVNIACMSHQLENYCKVINRAYIHRRLVSMLDSYKTEAVNTDEPEQLINKLAGELTALVLDEGPNYVTSMDLMKRVMQEIEKRVDSGGVTGIPTGFPDLDRMIHGFQRKHLIFLGATPKQGKTALSLELLTNVARQGYSGLFFSLEMSLDEVAGRQVSSYGDINNTKLQRGILSDEEMVRLVGIVGELSQVRIGWVDRPGLNTTEIKAICRQYKYKHGLDIVVVDQLDKVATRIYSGENQTDAIKRNVVALKQIAQELDCTVLVLCQLLDKVVSTRLVPRPQHGDEKGSSAPSEDADIILYLWRPEFYWPDQYRGMAELIIARQRSGPSGAIWLTWRPKIVKFSSMPRDDWPKEVVPDGGGRRG